MKKRLLYLALALFGAPLLWGQSTVVCTTSSPGTVIGSCASGASDPLSLANITGTTSNCGGAASGSANSVCLSSNAVTGEGSSADTSETVLAFGNATADGTLTMTGTSTGVNLQVTAPANTELRVTQTLASAGGNQYGLDAKVTTAGSTAGALQGAIFGETLAGYTGTGRVAGTVGFSAGATTSGTDIENQGTFGVLGYTSAGSINAGGWFKAEGSGAVNNIGVFGFGKGSTTRQIGVWGTTGTSAGAEVGVFAQYGYPSALPTLTDTALLADNGSHAVPIFIARDNGTAVFTIADGGAISVTGTLIGDLLSAETVATTKAPATTESAELYTNGADVDGQAITLPNDPTAGACYEFALTSTDSSGSFAIAPSAGETLMDAATTCSTSFSATAKGATARICAVSGGSGGLWLVMSKNGTWTCS